MHEWTDRPSFIITRTDMRKLFAAGQRFNLLVVRGGPRFKSHIECLCHINLPFLCLDWVYHPSMTIGAPIAAPKQWQIPPKQRDLAFSLPKWVVRGGPSLKSHIECLCHVNLPCLCLDWVYHPSMTIGAPIAAPKQWQIPPKQRNFALSLSKCKRKLWSI